MRIKNWKEFQHFKDRSPPWIKLHRNILDQRDIMMISDRSFKILTCLWLLASEDKHKEGNLPPVADIAFRLRMSENDITQSLQELTPWVDLNDITTISNGYQVGPPETETEAYKEETETENLCERDFILNLFKTTFKKPMSSADFQKLPYLMRFAPEKIEKAFAASVGKKSLNYTIAILEAPEPEKKKPKGRLRK